MYRPSMNFTDRSNSMKPKSICIKCKGDNPTRHTMCEPCGSALELCEVCKTPMTEAQIKFSKSVYSKLLCYYNQPAQWKARRLREGKNAR